MRSALSTFPLLFLGLGLLSCDSGSGGGGAMTTMYDSVSYAIGMNSGTGLKDLIERDSVEIDIDLLVAGMRDALAEEGDVRLDDTVAQQVIMRFQTEMQTRMQQKAQVEGEANLSKGNDFLVKNRSAEGIQVTESGLQYKVLEEGEGEAPDENDEVTVEYRGTLIDGTEFDASKPGEPVTFPVNRVIPGWTEALQLMKPGGHYKLFIPAELAYGQGGSPPKIGPNEVLIFDVKLVSVNRE